MINTQWLIVRSQIDPQSSTLYALPVDLERSDRVFRQSIIWTQPPPPLCFHFVQDVTRDLAPLPGGTRRGALEEEDQEETLSLRSMPSMRSTLSHASKVKRSRGFPKRHTIPELRLPPVTKIHPDPRYFLTSFIDMFLSRPLLDMQHFLSLRENALDWTGVYITPCLHESI